jgi:hypothetical protein
MEDAEEAVVGANEDDQLVIGQYDVVQPDKDPVLGNGGSR